SPRASPAGPGGRRGRKHPPPHRGPPAIPRRARERAERTVPYERLVIESLAFLFRADPLALFSADHSMERILTSHIAEHPGKTVRLAGWIHTLRSFREVKFLILRDRGGLAQTVIDPGSDIDVASLGREYCVELE